MAISQSTHRNKGRAPRIMFAASLREIAARGNPQLRGQSLQKYRHETGNEHSAQKRVAESRAAAQIRRPVARDPYSQQPPDNQARQTRAFSGKKKPRARWEYCGATREATASAILRLAADSSSCRQNQIRRGGWRVGDVT